MESVCHGRRLAAWRSAVAVRALHIRSVLIFGCLFCPVAARPQLNPAEKITQFTQDLWGTAAGLPHNSVDAITQTSEGYLWIGTEEGLARFDGVRFSTFDTRNTPVLRSNHISALLADSHRNLWIGTQGGGLTVLHEGIFRTYSSADGLVGDTVLCLQEGRDGSIWIGTSGAGLARFFNGRFETYTSRNGLPNDSVFALAADSDGSLWIGTHAGLSHFKNGMFSSYGSKEGLSDTYVKCLKLAHNGELWIGTNGGGLNLFANGKFKSYTVRQGMSSNTIWALAEDRSGSLWIGTFDGGIDRLQNGKISIFSDKDGLPSNRALALFIDKDSSLWIGTGGTGIARLRAGPFQSITSRDGLSNDVVLPVYQDHEGAIWLGTNGGGLNRIADGKITNYSTKNGMSDNLVFSIAEYKDNSLWIATHKGLDRLKDGKFTVFGKADGLPGDSILCLYRDRDGELWAGSRGGLSRFDGRRFHTYTKNDGLSSDYVVSLYQDRERTLWAGTGGGGLNSFRNGRFQSYSTKDGLSSNSVWALTGDADGTLWIGTGGGGLNRLQSGRFATYNVHQGLFDDEIFQIIADKFGYLWMSSNRGVFKVSKAELNLFAAGRTSTINSVPYGTSDGMKSNECNGGFQPAGWQTQDGRLLFPTMKGLAIVDPGRLQSRNEPPPVLIESATVDGTELDLSGKRIAKPGDGKLEFTFTALSLIGSEKISFRYKLDGFENAWVASGQRRTAYYTNIPPGTYRFEVSARMANGDWSDAADSITLTLLPHFYQTTSFYVFCGGLLAGLCFGVYQLRIKALKANEKRLVNLVDQRTQALQEQVNEKERAHAELAAAQQSLLDLSRRSGMAEVATGVLHNVGNVLNSVNVGAGVISGKVRESRIDNLVAAVKMLQENASDLSSYVQHDPKGQRVLPYLAKLAQHLQNERTDVLSEVESLTGHIEHIKEIVNTQQDYARASVLTEMVSIPKAVEQALKVAGATLSSHAVKVICELEEVPEVSLAKHRLVEILVNLIRNAKQSVLEQNGLVQEVRIRVRRYSHDRIRIEVQDTGVGLSEENVTRIFAHGFTTKRDGHGFGLHSGALAARQMGCSLWAESAGPGKGATFILELPVDVAASVPELSAI
jgi:ligand-binding sensor domain-containing protein/signal transduction histidine kinase